MTMNANFNGLSTSVAQLFNSSPSVTPPQIKTESLNKVFHNNLMESPKSSRNSVNVNNSRQKQNSTFKNKPNFNKPNLNKTNVNKTKYPKSTQKTKTVPMYTKNANTNLQKESRKDSPKNSKNPCDVVSSGFHSDSSISSSTSKNSTNSKSSAGSRKGYVPLAKLNPSTSPKKNFHSPKGKGRSRLDSYNDLLYTDLGGVHKDKFAGCAPAPAASALPLPPASWLFVKNDDIIPKVQSFFNDFKPQSPMPATA